MKSSEPGSVSQTIKRVRLVATLAAALVLSACTGMHPIELAHTESMSHQPDQQASAEISAEIEEGKLEMFVYPATRGERGYMVVIDL